MLAPKFDKFWHEWRVSKRGVKIGMLRVVDIHVAQAVSKHFAQWVGIHVAKTIGIHFGIGD